MTPAKRWAREAVAEPSFRSSWWHVGSCCGGARAPRGWAEQGLANICAEGMRHCGRAGETQAVRHQAWDTVL